MLASRCHQNVFLLMLLMAAADSQENKNPFLEQNKGATQPWRGHSPPGKNPFTPPPDQNDRRVQLGNDINGNSIVSGDGKKNGAKATDNGNSRNEMHKKGGPFRTTAWTRWTPTPKPNSPWADSGSDGDTAYCNGKAYNIRDNICCQGSVQRRQGLRPACCGSQSLDFVFNMCCDGQITARTSARPLC